MRHVALLSLAAAASLGCAIDSPPTHLAPPPSPEAGPMDADTGVLPQAPPSEATTLPPWGWIETQGSPVSPFCSTALVGPRTAVTASACIQDQGAWELLVGFGAASEGTGVQALEPLASDPRLTVLWLDSEPRGATPADLAPPRHGSQVRGVSQLYTAMGEPRQHWYWHGRVSNRALDRVRANVAEHLNTQPPNCHGDPGAPLFDDDGALIGTTVAAHTASTPCATAFTMVPVEHTPDAFDEALAREF